MAPVHKPDSALGVICQYYGVILCKHHATSVLLDRMSIQYLIMHIHSISIGLLKTGSSSSLHYSYCFNGSKKTWRQKPNNRVTQCSASAVYSRQSGRTVAETAELNHATCHRRNASLPSDQDVVPHCQTHTHRQAERWSRECENRHLT